MKSNARKKAVYIFGILLIFLLTLSVFSGCKKKDGAKAISVTIASDTHVVANSIITADWYGDLSGSERMRHVSEAIFHTFCDTVTKKDSDFLLITGDLTEYGDKASEQAVADILKKVEKKGTKVFVINGNHDVGNGRLNQADFKEIYADFGYSEALSTYEGTLSYTADLDDSHRLIAIDDIDYYDDDGIHKKMMDEDHKSWVYEQVFECINVGKTPVVIAHIPFIPHFPALIELFVGTGYGSFTSLTDFFAEKGVYSFVGHMHINDIRSKSVVLDENEYVYNEVMTGCLSMYGGNYRTMTWRNGKAYISTRHLEKVDDEYLSDLVPEEDEKELEKDYIGYGEKALNNFIGKIINEVVGDGGTLDYNFEGEGAECANAIIDILRNDVLMKVVNTPYYKKDAGDGESMESILEQFGMAMIDVEYSNFREVALDCVKMVVDGDENLNNYKFKFLFKYSVYELFYFINEASAKINSELEKCGIESRINLNLQKLYTIGALECYESGFVPSLINVVKKLDISALQSDIVQAALNGLSKDLTILQNELVIGFVNSYYAANAFSGIEKYIGLYDIDLAGLAIEGVIGTYIADLIIDPLPADCYLEINEK